MKRKRSGAIKAFRKAIGEKLSPIRPIIKAILMIIIGALITRESVGAGLLTTNIVFGSFSYCLLAIAGLLTIQLLVSGGFSIKDVKSSKSRVNILFWVLYGLSIVVMVMYVSLYYLSYYLIIVPVAIGFLWIILRLYASKRNKTDKVVRIIYSLIFSLGFLYGALLNSLTPPIYVYFFFVSTLFLQLSRELFKILEDKYKYSFFEMKPGDIYDGKLLKQSLKFQISAIMLLFLPVFFGVKYLLLYLIPFILSTVFISLASLFTFKCLSTKENAKKINRTIKIGIYFQIFAILTAS